MAYLLVLLKTLMGNAVTALSKNYSQRTCQIPGAKLIYVLGAHSFAAVFQFVLAGGSVSLDKLTLMFAAIYGLNCVMSSLVGLLAFEKTTLVYRMLFSGAGALMVPFVFDLLQGVQFGVGKYLAVFLRLMTVLIPLLFTRQKFGNLPTCLALFLLGGSGTVILRLLAQYCGASAGYSFCFWTNLLTLPFVAVVAVGKRGFVELKQDIGQIKPILYLFLFVQTALNNAISLLNIYLLTVVDATTYSLMSAAVGVVITTTMSVWIYKEKMTKQALLCLILSLLAIIAGVIPI